MNEEGCCQMKLGESFCNALLQNDSPLDLH